MNLVVLMVIVLSIIVVLMVLVVLITNDTLIRNFAFVTFVISLRLMLNKLKDFDHDMS